MVTQVTKRYILGEYTLDPDARLLTLSDQSIHLPNRPFQVLLYLVEHRDRLVGRRELIDMFWEGHDVYDVTLTKCLGKIRKALADTLENPRFIETRYAEGYRFIGPVKDELIDDPHSIVAVERVRGVRIVVEEETIEEPPSPTESAIESAGPGALQKADFPRRTGRRFVWVSAFLALASLAITTAAVRRYYFKHPPSNVPARSIAVMPLKNLTGDPANDYLSDGLSETLINSLSRIPDLRVISRTSSFAYKGRDVDAREVGSRLNVASLLEGSVEKSGDRLMITARLVSATDGSVIWASDNYDRKFEDIFIVQSEITRGISSALKSMLGPESEHRATLQSEESSAAYDAYLKGRFFWNKRDADDLKKSVEYYDLAIKRDPNYAPAYAGLGETYAVMEMNSIVPPKTGAPLAEQNARRALELDGSLASPYAALGLIKSFSDWDWKGGEQLFIRALAANPGNATVHHWFANSLLARGHFEQAESELDRAAELDPLSIPIANSLGETFYYWRQGDRCVEQARKILGLDPNSMSGTLLLARGLSETGRYDEALTAIGMNDAAIAERATLLAKSGRRPEAQKLTAELAKGEFGANNPFYVACLYAAMDDKEESFRWLDRARAVHQADLSSIKIEPLLDPLRSDPRFAELVSFVGLSD